MADANGNGNGLAKIKVWLPIIQFIGTAIVGLVVVYGTSKAYFATLENKITNLEAAQVEMMIQIKESQRRLDAFRDTYVSLREFTGRMDALADTLRRIEANQQRVRER
jgi:CHASE1-domain containing sensor protein